MKTSAPAGALNSKKTLVDVLKSNIGFLVFKLYPFGSSLIYSFSDFNLHKGITEWGLMNYQEAFTSSKITTALSTTFKYAFITVPLKLAFALFIAYILNFKIKGVNFFRTAYYIPSILGGSRLYGFSLMCSLHFFFAVFSEKVSCLVVASCVSLVSPQAAKLTCSAAPPLPTKPYGFAGAPTIAACSGVGTLPATSGHFVPKSGSLRCFPCRGIPFRTVIHFSRCSSSMNYPKSTRKKCNPRNFARIAF